MLLKTSQANSQEIIKDILSFKTDIEINYQTLIDKEDFLSLDIGNELIFYLDKVKRVAAYLKSS